MKLTWLGHSATHLEIGGLSVLIDPFLTGNPTYPEGWEDRLDRLDVIAVTHGHDDHVGDTLRLAEKYEATLVAQFELAMWLSAQGLSKLQPMNTGGTISLDGVRFSMVPAFHSASIIRDGQTINLGDPAGLVIRDDRNAVYHAGDTGLFSDMALIQRLFRPTVGLLPCGDRFTMGPEQAAIACNEFLEFETIIPIHWGTFDLLPGRPERLAELVTRGSVRTLEPGEVIETSA